MPYETVLYEQQGAVVTITLNRPEVLNALSPQLEGELHEALDEADQDPTARAIILTGAGRAFSSGYDLRGDDQSPSRLDPTGQAIGDFIRTWERNDHDNVLKLLHLWHLSKPVIAAVNGYAMGGGFWYQAAADITIASEQAVFGQPEVRHISNTTFLFAALCGWKVANRYALTGDHIDAREALRIGLVNEVVPHDELLPAAERLAHRIAMVPEPSVRMNKQVTMKGLLTAGVNAGMMMNSSLSALAHTSHLPERDDMFEAQRTGGLRSFLEARDGKFTPEPFGPKARD